VSVDTAAIVREASAAAGIDMGDSGAAEDTSTAAPAETTAAPEGTAAAPEDGATPAPEAAAEPKPEEVAELTAEEAAGAHLPVNRHKAILQGQRTRYENQIRERDQKLSTYESPEVQQKLQAVEIADTHPELFVEVLVADPKLRPLFEKHFSAGAANGAPSGMAPAPPAAVGGRPGPDYVAPDGTVGFTPQGFEAVLEWERQQARKEFEATLEERLKPVQPLLSREENRQKFEQERAAKQQEIDEAIASWPGFKDNLSDVLAFFQRPENARKNLMNAYVSVVVPKMQQNEADVRARVIKEMSGKSAAVIRPPSPAPAQSGGVQTTAQIIAERSRAAGLIK
jgi:hypothetical protein